MRIFHLIRKEDVSGVSGTGIVAEGVIFQNGKCVLSWKGDKSSVNIYESLDEMMKVHGHEGKTTYKTMADVYIYQAS